MYTFYFCSPQKIPAAELQRVLLYLFASRSFRRKAPYPVVITPRAMSRKNSGIVVPAEFWYAEGRTTLPITAINKRTIPKSKVRGA